LDETAIEVFIPGKGSIFFVLYSFKVGSEATQPPLPRISGAFSVDGKHPGPGGG
jgi:hypothetical protein